MGASRAPFGVTRRARAEHLAKTPDERNTTTGAPRGVRSEFASSGPERAPLLDPPPPLSRACGLFVQAAYREARSTRYPGCAELACARQRRRLAISSNTKKNGKHYKNQNQAEPRCRRSRIPDRRNPVGLVPAYATRGICHLGVAYATRGVCHLGVAYAGTPHPVMTPHPTHPLSTPLSTPLASGLSPRGNMVGVAG